jgi:hypothetical protein
VAQRAGRCAGKIASLAGFLREHGAAVEADLAFRAGPQDQLTQLGRGLSWRRLEILVVALATAPDSLLHRKLAGDEWTRDQHLLALVLDALNGANWQRSPKGTPRPKPVSPLAKPAEQGDRTGNTAGRSNEAVLRQLHAYRTGAFDRSE